MTELTLENVEKMLRGLAPAQLDEIRAAAKPFTDKPWLPQPGPQTEAFNSEADETLYGGAVGGGKTDLLLGLATTAHKRSVIFRQQSVDLTGLWERLGEIVPNPLKQDASRKTMRTKDGRLIETGHLELPGSERAHMGRARDFYGFDEAALLDEMRVNFVIQWLRSTDQGQRKRIVFATNPPIPAIKDGVMTDVAVGDWLLRWFAPWVDDTAPNPAKTGELRWCFMRAEGDRLATIWVPGPGCYDPETGEATPDATPQDIEDGKVSVAKSRTFIRSLLKDNAFLTGTGYAEKMSGTPEPLKSMLLRGDFTIKGADHPMQVIPTEWLLLAEERWKAREWNEVKRLRQIVLAADVAQGGVDTTIIAPLYETDYFDELITAPGNKTPTGVEVMTMLLMERMDGSLVVLDGTGGWGGSTRDLLSTHHKIEAEMHVSSKTDGSWTPDLVYKYSNLRTKMWWEFRLALDPQSGFDVCLPPNARLRAQLTAPHFGLKGKVLEIESKDALRTRLNSSTDEADAVLMAWQYRDQALSALMNPVDDIVERLNGRTGKNAGNPVDEYDPLKGW